MSLEPNGGWSLQTPLAHKEKGPARDLFSGLQCENGGDEDSGTQLSPMLMSHERRVLRNSSHYLFGARAVTVVISRTAWISTARVTILLRVG